MENSSLFRLRPIDWRWLVVSFCFLILFHLFPSFLIAGMRNFFSLFPGDWGFLIWLGCGVFITCTYVGFRSRGITILEPGIASMLYAVTLLLRVEMPWRFASGFRSVAIRIVFLLFAFAVGSLGAAFGEWLQVRKEKR